MGLLSSIRENRRQKKAAYKAAKVKAKAEAKASAKLEKRKEAYLRKTAKQVRKADDKQLKARRKHEEKMAKASLEQLKAGTFNAKTVMRYAGAARVAAPVVLPLLYRGLTQLQNGSLSASARSQGVKGSSSAGFAVQGGSHLARIEKVRGTLDSGLPSGLQRDLDERLDDLTRAVKNSESMNKAQSQRVLDSVSNDLDLIESQIAESSKA